MSNLVSDGGTNGLAGGRIDPKGADYVIVARTSGEPLSLIEQVDLHLVLVEVALALANGSHAEAGDVGVVELLSLLEQVVDIDAKFGRNRFGIGIVTKACFPEYKEVFGLLHAGE